MQEACQAKSTNGGTHSFASNDSVESRNERRVQSGSNLNRCSFSHWIQTVDIKEELNQMIFGAARLNEETI